MKGIIDRFEGDFAVIELDGEIMKNVRKDILPASIKEGSAIKFIDGEWQIDNERTKNMKAEIDALAEDLFE